MRAPLALVVPVVLAFSLLPSIAVAGDPDRPVPAHGGVILELGSGAARVELTHDAREGVVTVYAFPRDAKKAAFDEDPVLVVATDTGPKEIALTLVSGELNVWRAKNATLLRTAPLAGHIRGKVDGRWHETSVRSSGSSGVHGGVIVDIAPGVGQLEFVHDAREGSAAVYAIADQGKPLVLDEAPILVVLTDVGRSETTLTKVAGVSDQWSATDVAALKTDVRRAGELRLKIAGTRYVLQVELPVVPQVVEASLETPLTVHGGSILTLGGRDVEVVHDSDAGSLTLFPVGDKPLAFAEAPVVFVAAPSGPREIPLVAAPEGVWRATDPVLENATVELRVRAIVAGKSVEALVVRRGPHGGAILAAVGSNARIEWVHADRARTATLYVLAPPAGPVLTQPVLVLATGAGLVELKFALAEPNRWTVTDDAIAKDPKGRVRWMVGDKTFEAPLPPSSTPHAVR